MLENEWSFTSVGLTVVILDQPVTIENMSTDKIQVSEEVTRVAEESRETWKKQFHERATSWAISGLTLIPVPRTDEWRQI